MGSASGFRFHDRGERKAEGVAGRGKTGRKQSLDPVVMKGNSRHLVGQSMESQPGRLCGLFQPMPRGAELMPVTGL